MQGLLVLIVAVSAAGDNPEDIVIQPKTGRVHLKPAADDSTMLKIPNTARTLFMLSANQVSPEGLQQLSRLRQIEFLRLNRSSHADAALQSLTDHPALRNLMMWSDTGITAQGIQQLSTIPSLRSLDFTDVPLNRAALNAMPKHLESLTISDSRIGDAGLAALPVFPNLKSLKVKHDELVTDAGLIAFIDRHPHLEGLSVDVASDRFLASLLKLPNLKSLWLSGPPITAKGLQVIGRLQTLERLTLSSELNDEMRARVRQLPNRKLNYVAHRGKHIPLKRRLAR